ncbi:MAG: DUF4065 domain-containing protein [Propioniciclava sp.]|uniref:Panacea domain-containing protein n=1 Tax=Propioniciclava sp. TaxID=2038686 RepID=UPI0039E2B6A9
MSVTTVFDVATALIEKSGQTTISTVKLQKLCFYSFGWYAHLTGEHLFPEAFYAMEKGPVVGELLSAHAGQREVGHDALMAQLAERDGFQGDLGAYVEQVLDAIWRYYGSKDPWTLVELTHQDEVWKDSWSSRPAGSRRGDMPQQDIIDFFLGQTSPREMDLPLSLISFVSQTDVDKIESAGFSNSFVADVRRLRAAQ